MATNRYQGVDPLLTGVSIGYQNSAYIADQLLPTFPVSKQSDKHFIYDKGRFRVEDNKRGAGAASKEVTLNLTTGLPYFCEDHALKEFVLDEDVDGAAPGMDPMVDATENVSELHLVAKEVEAAGMLTDTSIMTQNTTLSGTSQWSDYTNSDPFSIIETGKAAIHASLHVDPNVLVLGKQVWDKLKHHPSFLERVKYSQKGVISEDLLANLIGVDRVIIAGAGKNTAVDGQADSMSYIWGKHALLAYVNPRLGRKTVTLGVTYQWKTRKVERIRGADEEDRKGTYVRVGDHYYDQNIVAASAGYLVKNAVA